MLFNVFIEKAIVEINERKSGMMIQEYEVKNNRISDDIAILKENQKELEKKKAEERRQ